MQNGHYNLDCCELIGKEDSASSYGGGIEVLRYLGSHHPGGRIIYEYFSNDDGDVFVERFKLLEDGGVRLFFDYRGNVFEGFDLYYPQ